jgi:heptosyltransferase-2
MKILVISLAGIGDTLIATPLVRELRNNFPLAEIDAFVMWKGSQELLATNPNLDSVYQNNFFKNSWVESLKSLLQLRQNRYDIALLPFPQSRWHYSGVARLIAPRLLLSLHYYADLDLLLSTHATAHNLTLLRKLGVTANEANPCYEIYCSSSDLAFTEQNAISGAVGIHIGSGTTKNLKCKRWPLANYRKLISALNEIGKKVVLIGGPEEEQETRTLAGKNASYVPTRNIRQAAALMRTFNAFISVDSCLMHIASAVGIPQVVIQAPTWNPCLAPLNNHYELVPNAALEGRSPFDFYRFDGRPIRKEYTNVMDQVSVSAVLNAYARVTCCDVRVGPVRGVNGFRSVPISVSGFD